MGAWAINISKKQKQHLGSYKVESRKNVVDESDPMFFPQNDRYLEHLKTIENL